MGIARIVWHWGSNKGSSRARKPKKARIAASRAFRVRALHPRHGFQMVQVRQHQRFVEILHRQFLDAFFRLSAA